MAKFAHLLVQARTRTTQVPLRENNDSLPAGQILFEKRVPGRHWHTIISTFNYEIDGREPGFHVEQAKTVMAEKV